MEGSPGQPYMTPEANEAYMRKLQELEVYVPLVARMIDRLKRQQGDDRANSEQFVKLNSLYSLLTDKNKRYVCMLYGMRGDGCLLCEWVLTAETGKRVE